MAIHDIHVVEFSGVAITTSLVTYLELQSAAAPQDLILYHAWADFDGSASGASPLVQLVRKSAAGTGTATPPAALPLSGSSAGLSSTSAATVRWKDTAEGTISGVLVERYVNPAGGIDLVQALGRDITVPGGGIVAIRVQGATGVLPKLAVGFEWAE